MNTTWAGQPLYRVQEAAVRQPDGDAVDELGRRYAADYVTAYYTPGRSTAHLTRLADAYAQGFRGQESPYAYGRGGNFAAPYRTAYRIGKRLRGELETIMAAIPPKEQA